MYHHVDYCRIKTFLKACLIFSSLFFTSNIFAGAAEQWSGTPRQMTIADYGMRTRNGIGVENVRAANGMINADITQRVTVDGSNATINTKVAIPANDDSFKRNTAKHAKNLLRGGAYAAGAAAAMKVILDGVDWVMDPKNNTVQYPDIGYDDGKEYMFPGIQGYFPTVTTAMRAAESKYDWNCNSSVPHYKVICYRKKDNSLIFSDTLSSRSKTKPSPPSNSPVPDGVIEDAFYNWFKNNTHSLTDPVTTYIYSPKDSQGNALPKSPPGSDPSFGPNEITDEMMNNYMEHRDANLQNPYTTSIADSTQTDTTQNPEGTKTETRTNPDGSKTETKTDTKVDPDTGEITTTKTETTTMPDGSTSTKTETSTQTKPKPETSELPAFCEYAAALCTWMNRDTEHKADEKSLWQKITEWFDWTKENPDSENPDNEVDVEKPEEFDTSVFKKNRFTVSKSCPMPETHTIRLSGISVDFSFDLTPICTVLEFARPALIACSYLYAAYIVIGAARG